MKKILQLAAITLSIFFISSCATLPEHPLPEKSKVYGIKSIETLISLYAPLFVIQDSNETYDLIGTPTALFDEKGREKIIVSVKRAALYTETRTFKTEKGSYRNLIYRIHFEKIPFGLIPFYLTTGKNVGIFVIVTLNDKDEPVLISTVHTCGCYLGFIATSFMPEDAYPDGWSKERQDLYGENIPAFLSYPDSVAVNWKLMVLLRHATHRVMDVWLESNSNLPGKYNIVKMDHKPLESLERLPIEGGGTTSFYETSGPRKGWVKGSHKPLERLFMSWWAFDWRIGEDKKLGKDKNDGTTFYTSLKPWARDESDLRDFPAFLKYWGWKL